MFTYSDCVYYCCLDNAKNHLNVIGKCLWEDASNNFKSQNGIKQSKKTQCHGMDNLSNGSGPRFFVDTTRGSQSAAHLPKCNKAVFKKCLLYVQYVY